MNDLDDRVMDTQLYTIFTCVKKYKDIKMDIYKYLNVDFCVVTIISLQYITFMCDCNKLSG